VRQKHICAISVVNKLRKQIEHAGKFAPIGGHQAGTATLHFVQLVGIHKVKFVDNGFQQIHNAVLIEIHQQSPVQQGLITLILRIIGNDIDLGFSIIGQPHVMVRFMAMQDPDSMVRVRCWYYGWWIVFYAMTTGVGMLSRIYLSDPGSFDAELALPTMALQLLPPALVGLVLAGIFAATMSTADSLILSCSASITHDLLPHRIERPWLLKGATALVTMLALGWALSNRQTVFNLVIMAWSGLASAFAPLLLVLAFGGRPSQRTAILMMFTGIATALLWRWLGWQDAVYEGMPGILAGLAVYGLSMAGRPAVRTPVEESA